MGEEEFDIFGHLGVGVSDQVGVIQFSGFDQVVFVCLVGEALEEEAEIGFGIVGILSVYAAVAIYGVVGSADSAIEISGPHEVNRAETILRVVLVIVVVISEEFFDLGGVGYVLLGALVDALLQGADGFCFLLGREGA
jgi:hypothetical protein